MAAKSKRDPEEQRLLDFVKATLATTKARHSEAIHPSVRVLVERGEEEGEYRISVSSASWLDRVPAKVTPKTRSKR